MDLRLSLAFLLLSMTITGCGNGSSNTTLQLVQEYEKSAYSVGEEIFVNIHLINVSQNPVIINSRMSLDRRDFSSPLRELSFLIITPDQTVTDFFMLVNHSPIYPDDSVFIELLPGESISKRIELSHYYRFEQIGEYSITAYYENAIDPKDGPESWKGQLSSEHVQVWITQDQ